MSVFALDAYLNDGSRIDFTVLSLPTGLTRNVTHHANPR